MDPRDTHQSSTCKKGVMLFGVRTGDLAGFVSSGGQRLLYVAGTRQKKKREFIQLWWQMMPGLIHSEIMNLRTHALREFAVGWYEYVFDFPSWRDEGPSSWISRCDLEPAVVWNAEIQTSVHAKPSSWIWWPSPIATRIWLKLSLVLYEYESANGRLFEVRAEHASASFKDLVPPHDDLASAASQ